MPTVAPTSLTDIISVSVYVKRDIHENGMTLQQYADAVMAGTEPVLGHDEYVYQFGARPEDVARVVAYFEAQGVDVDEAHTGKSVVALSGTVEQYNRIFGITVETVTETNRTYITHSTPITVPNEIADVVDGVLGLDNQVSFITNSAIVSDLAVPQASLDPNILTNPNPRTLASAYKFPRNPGSDQVQGLGESIAIVELGGGYTQANLNSSFARVGLAPPTVVSVSVDGGTNNPSDFNSSVEVMLDIYAAGAVSPGSTIAVYFAPNSWQGFIDCILAAVNDTTNRPSVISISWGTIDSGTTSLIRSLMDQAFQSGVVAGITTFVAAGDYGTQALSGTSTYTVQYPATSPYVVACGGTIVTINNDLTIANEVVWNQTSYGTGGGVSNIYSLPAWQSGLSTKTYPAGVISAVTKRAIPDVSAMATAYQFYCGLANQFLTGVLGTSAVAPLLAGFAARVNQLAGKRMGFVNSLWYANPSAFRDITVGNNACPATVGYDATAGWDACTGLGSPDGQKVYQLYKIGSTFPKANYAFRPNKTTGGVAYPRVASGVR